MKQTNWPDVAPINQKNYYTYEADMVLCRGPLFPRTNSAVAVII